MRNFRRVTLVRAASLVVFFLLLSARAATPADDWSAPAQKLAKKISEKLNGNQTIALSFQNFSSAAAEQANRASKALDTELQTTGLHLRAKGEVSAPSEEANVAQVKVTLAENLRGYVWVAEIVKGETREVVMVSVPRAASGSLGMNAPAMLLRSQKIFEQETPIVDFALLDQAGGAPARLLILESKRIVLYSFDQGLWQMREGELLPGHETPQRSMRGRLIMVRDTYVVTLPGETCTGTLRDTVTLQCESPRLLPDEQGLDILTRLRRQSPSFSDATIEMGGKQVTVLAGQDGIARLYESEDAKEPAATFSGWGSELAGLKSGCGSGWQLLVTRSGDWTEHDAVQAMEIEEKQAVTTSPALEFAGPIMVLHALEKEDMGIAVVRNLQTGRYEAHTLSVSCGR